MLQLFHIHILPPCSVSSLPRCIPLLSPARCSSLLQAQREFVSCGFAVCNQPSNVSRLVGNQVVQSIVSRSLQISQNPAPDSVQSMTIACFIHWLRICRILGQCMAFRGRDPELSVFWSAANLCTLLSCPGPRYTPQHHHEVCYDAGPFLGRCGRQSTSHLPHGPPGDTLLLPRRNSSSNSGCTGWLRPHLPLALALLTSSPPPASLCCVSCC